jgi:hypothetical protein
MVFISVHCGLYNRSAPPPPPPPPSGMGSTSVVVEPELQPEQVVVGAVFFTMVCFAFAMRYRSIMRNQAAKTIGAGSGRQQSTIVSSFLRSISSSHLAI